MRILGLSGSLRRDSHNSSLLRAAAKALPPGVELEQFDGLAELPHYDADLDVDPAPVSVERLRDAIADADGVLIATPEYNGSIPGGLKNAVDWASRPFPDNAWHDKPVAVIGASTGIFGAVWAQAQLRKSLGIAGARVLDAELAVGSAQGAFLPSGALRDPGLATGLRSVVGALVDALAPPFSRDSALRHGCPATPKTGPPTTAQAVQNGTSEPVVAMPLRCATT